jgi:predicted TIM-barrel fold metal-dependent hydrolase
MTNRRDFLRQSSVAACITAFGALPAVATGLVDAKCHRLSIGENFVFPAWLSAINATAQSVGNRGDRAFSAALSRRMPMLGAPSADAVPGTRQVVGLPAPGLELFEVRQARNLSIQANDLLAERVGTSAGRLAGLASIAASDPLAVKEAERAINHLKLSGLSLGATRGISLDHPTLRPIFEFAAANKVPVYLPAAYSTAVDDSPYRALGTAGVITGAAADSSRHATQLIFGAVLDDYPALRVVLGRLGEGTPYWYGQLQEAYRGVKNSGRAFPNRAAADYFSENIFLTTADMSPRVLGFCDRMLGKSRLLISHDHIPPKLFADTAGGKVDLLALTAVHPSSLLINA